MIVRELKEEESKSIIIVEKKEDKTFFIGEIVAVGTETSLTIGKKVLLNRFIGGTVEWEGETLWLFAPDDIIAIEE